MAIVISSTRQSPTPVDCVSMGTSDLLVVQMSMRDEWRYALMSSGGRCAMTHGEAQMQAWSVLNLDIHPQVKEVIFMLSYALTFESEFTVSSCTLFLLRRSYCSWQCYLWSGKWRDLSGQRELCWN